MGPSLRATVVFDPHPARFARRPPPERGRYMALLRPSSVCIPSAGFLVEQNRTHLGVLDVDVEGFLHLDLEPLLTAGRA